MRTSQLEVSGPALVLSVPAQKNTPNEQRTLTNAPRWLEERLKQFDFKCETQFMARQFIYHMRDLSKSYSGGKKVLDGVHLSFYPDAKIGVLGPNGAGKSTLLKIMAGLDTEFTGEAWVEEGATVGYLSQEPELDETKSVRDNVMDGVADKKALLDAFNDISMKLADDYSDELMEEMSGLQEKIEAQDLWDLDSRVDMAMDALRCPPDDANVATLSGGERRRVALCRLLLEKPDLLLLDEPTN
ncbi:MAG: ATP-binding cassette domain-containing protein, partial [Fimbriimonadaceae bacterium]|nr:ATP-binding cassette domain-containing protein [Alphaproteobacteria bacterium]